jgi:uncharacterized glyoxalase superfamily protein PhnB
MIKAIERETCHVKNPLIQPYLFFGGRCEEALEFYRTAIGAQVEMVMRFNESPEPPPPGTLQPGFEDKGSRTSGLRIMFRDLSRAV